MLIQGIDTRILLDAGLPLTHLKKRLAKFRVAPGDLDAVLLTHEHGDHSRCACSLSRLYDVPVIANIATLETLPDRHVLRSYRTLDTGSTLAVGDFIVESFAICHDAVDPVGYNVYHPSAKVSCMTDSGIVPSDALIRIADADLVIVEANYDHQRLVDGPYPRFLKNRILGDYGHLSNEAAADLILSHASTGRPATYWLAHLSRTNNTPRMARKHVQRRLTDEKCTNAFVDVALRDSASLTWRPRSRALQMRLSGI